MNKVIIIGIGNFDRQDDGVAWHILCGVAQQLGRPVPQHPYEEAFIPEGEYPHLQFSLQLLPEMADDLAEYDHVLFVDAHTGAIPQDLQIIPIEPAHERNPLTHHMTPQTLLSLVETVYHQAPQAVLVSVRGYSFEYSNELSEATRNLGLLAVQSIMEWLNSCAK